MSPRSSVKGGRGRPKRQSQKDGSVMKTRPALAGLEIKRAANQGMWEASRNWNPISLIMRYGFSRTQRVLPSIMFLIHFRVASGKYFSSVDKYS